MQKHELEERLLKLANEAADKKNPKEIRAVAAVLLVACGAMAENTELLLMDHCATFAQGALNRIRSVNN